jgi:hypothetical protein
MTEENKPDLALVPEAPAAKTVSLTFRDDKSGKNILKIISVVSDEDQAKIQADDTGELLTKFIVNQVLFQFRLQGKVEAEKQV